MTDLFGKELEPTDVFARFPAIDGDIVEAKADQKNPAIRLYGRRFYKDQTPIEYLAEFLLVFASPKSPEGSGTYQLRLYTDNEKDIPRYYPEDRVALKLFAFFPSSKLETRHPAHRRAYLAALEAVKEGVSGSTDQEKEQTVRLIQSLFNGFVGVAKNRTWVTYTFLPASTIFLARELDWLNSEAVKDNTLIEWEDATKYFAIDRHNFMARGGELLFLQLANLFSKSHDPEVSTLLQYDEYKHIDSTFSLCDQLEKKLKYMLEEATGSLNFLVNFIEKKLEIYKLGHQKRSANLGWIPAASCIEAMLFASEMRNICFSQLDVLDKLDLLKTLCSIQVLRSLCFQARRVDEAERRTIGFVGNYVWVATDPEATIDTAIRQIAQNSFSYMEEILYRVLRKKRLVASKINPSIDEADKNGFQIFRKIAKEIGLVIPKKGGGQRFTLNQGLLRFLVAALVRPGERIHLDRFYQRVFSHYGIALGGRELTIALEWIGSESGGESYAVSSSTAWIEEALQQGGFLVELSDAVSMVHNPE